MELTKQQLEILNSKEPKIAVSASAAALKTSTLTEKVRQLLKEGVNPERIAVITFTRMAAAELMDRLGQDYKNGLFVGTIHSLAARFLSINGIGNLIKGAAEDEDFDKLFLYCQDLDISHTYDWVLLDEAQDTGKEELIFIFEKINPQNFFIAFDIKQSIYQFKNARPDLLLEALKQQNAIFYSLNENFRNASNILNYAKRIIRKTGYIDDSIPIRPITGEVIEMPYSSKVICNKIMNSGELRDWGILTRTNAQLDSIAKTLKMVGIPYNTFKQSQLNHVELESKMNENKVTLLTIHSAKGLSFNKVVVYGAVWWNENEYFLNYVAATRARDLLIWIKK